MKTLNMLSTSLKTKEMQRRKSFDGIQLMSFDVNDDNIRGGELKLMLVQKT